MGNLNEFFRDLGRNAYGLGENVASLGSAAIAEPVAGFAAMYDPANGAQAIREGMTYTPRTEAGKMYQQGAARTLGAIAQPAMPVIETWQRGVDIAGGYSPAAGAMLRTVPAAIGVAMGAKPALQAGRQMSNSLGAMQQRMVANANAPRALNTGYMGQRGAIGTQRPLTEFEQVHLLAQQRAALPVNQRGLGLAPDNTAMDRARAMGYQTAPSKEVYHATDVPFEGSIIDPSKSDFGFHVGTLEQANARIMARGKNGTFYGDGANVMPLMTNKYANLLKVTDEGTFHADSLAPQLVKKGLMSKEKAKLIDQEIGGNWDMDKIAAYDQEIRDLLTKEGYDGLKYKNMQEGEGMSYAFSNPSQVRSRFAAFDPFNRDSSNLLAQSAKFAPAATLGALMANEKRKDKRN